MKKGAFLNFMWIESNFNAENGVGKKILSQVKVLDSFTGGCDFINVPDKQCNPFFMIFNYMFNGFIYLYNLKSYHFENYDYIYVRRPIIVLPKILYFFKSYKKRKPTGIILYEIPTYPYDFEHKSLKGKILLIFDKLYRKNLYKYIDRIVTFTDDKEIWKIPTIKIINGIDCSKILPIKRNREFNDKEIHIIALAQFKIWHGIDRFLIGLANYYKNQQDVRIILHLVGEGTEYTNLVRLVNKLALYDYVIFHKSLFGDSLRNIFNVCDIALCSLGCHRQKIFYSSELKSREYLAYGIPFISSVKIDIVDDGFKFCKYVPADDSAIDINDVVNFCKSIYSNNNRQEIVSEIRKIAEEKCDMKTTMKPIVDFINGTNFV